MVRVLNGLSTESQGFDGGILPNGSDPEENFRPELVGEVLRVIWRKKTDAKVASICKFSDRQARDVMNGTVAMPAVLLSAINAALVRRPVKPKRAKN
jgi:hypothetical protein